MMHAKMSKGVEHHLSRVQFSCCYKSFHIIVAIVIDSPLSVFSQQWLMCCDWC